MPSSTASTPASTVQRWRCPAALRAKCAVQAACVAAIAVVFLPLWFAVPVAAACAAWGLGLAVAGGAVTVDEGAGLLELRMGLIRQRIRLVDVAAVLVEEAKVSIARRTGGEVSVYAWRKSPVDRLLGVPVVAADAGHAIARAVALAQAAEPEAAASAGAAASGPAGRTSARTRSRLATLLLAPAGALAILGALTVRVHWHNPVMSVASVVLALTLGVCGLVYLLAAIWILLTGRAARGVGSR